MSYANPRAQRVAHFLLNALMVSTLAACAAAQIPAQEATKEVACIAAPDGAVERRGCANAANLRAMVADPADLAGGRTLGPADGERETQAVASYQKGQAKAFDTPSAPPTTNITLGSQQ